MFRSTRMLIVLAIAASLLAGLAQLACAAFPYNLQNDVNISAGTTSGQWQLGRKSYVTADPVNMGLRTNAMDWTGTLPSACKKTTDWDGNILSGATIRMRTIMDPSTFNFRGDWGQAFYQNGSANATWLFSDAVWGTSEGQYLPIYPVVWGPRWYLEPNMIMVLGGYSAGNVREVARWTAPSSGVVTVYARFSSQMRSSYGDPTPNWFPNGQSNPPKCEVVLNDNGLRPRSILGSATLNGFAGGDSYAATGSLPVYTYSATLTLAVGDTLDFQAGGGDYCAIQAIIDVPSVQSGTLTGVVSSGGQPLPGAKVELVGQSAAPVTTDSAGYYAMIAPAGTYTLRTSKYTYITKDTANVVATGGQTTTTNVTLDLAPVVNLNGRVTANGSGAGLQGVKVTANDGNGEYTVNTNSAGYYSLNPIVGTYTVTATKTDYVGQKSTVVIPSGPAVTKNFALDRGWDMASDFSSASNPSSVWSFGAIDTTAAFLIDTKNSDCMFTSPSDWVWEQWQACGDQRYSGLFVKNTRGVSIEQAPSGFPAYYAEPGRVMTTSNQVGWASAARFTAPYGGVFNISSTFTGQSLAGTTGSVAITLNGSQVLAGGVIDGFVGRSQNGYTDSLGATPIIAVTTSMALNLNDVIEAKVSGGNGWTGVDLTVTSSALNNIVSGVVTSSLDGSPVAGANVALIGSTVNQTVTAPDGSYTLTALAGTYDLTVAKTNFNDFTETNMVIVSGTTVKNIVLVHKGIWDYADDFSTISNPNGQWSYGDSSGVYGWTGSLSWAGICPVWASTIGNHFGGGWAWKNFSDSPVYASINQGDWDCEFYAEPYMAGFTYYGIPHIVWTAPDSRVVKISVTATGQQPRPNKPDFDTEPTHVPKVILQRNGVQMWAGTVRGFAGREANGYTDSSSTSQVINPTPVATFETFIPVTSGDTFDLTASTQWPDGSPSAVGVVYHISTDNSGTQINAIKDIKNVAANTTIFLMTAKSLVAGTKDSKDFVFYLEEDDRSCAVKCMGGPTVADIAKGDKVTLSGKVVLDANNEKVIQVYSINSATTPTTLLKPLGTGSKALSGNVNKLVRVWGKLTSKAVNTDPVTSVHHPYLYFIINDGGQDVKVITTGQFRSMDDPQVYTPIGNYVSVTGSASRDSSGNIVVIPVMCSDILDHTGL